MVRLPTRTRVIVATCIAGGAATFLAALRGLASEGNPGTVQLSIAAAVCGTLVLIWIRPLYIYFGEDAETIHLDEGLFVFLALTVRPALIVVTFAVAAVLGQVTLRRSAVKSSFNTGMLVIASGAASGVVSLLMPHDRSLSWASLGVAILSAAVLFIANQALLSALFVSLGQSWRTSIFDGLGIIVLVAAAGTGVAASSAYLLKINPTMMILALFPLFILRITLAGYYQARHDRTRLEGLFSATLAAQAKMGEARESVREGLLESARSLLRCGQAELTDQPAGGGGLSARLSLLGQPLWLSVSERKGSARFDAADQALLDALAAVGSGALSNAVLYQQSRRQQQRVTAITSSLGEGVCAISDSGHITFVNPAAVAMLKWGDIPSSAGAALADPEEGRPAPEFLRTIAAQAISGGTTVSRYDACFRRSDGTALDVACTAAPVLEDGRSAGAVLVFRDISEQKKLMSELTHQALYDSLTALPNRRSFLHELTEALDRAGKAGERVAVLFGDIDRFKIINDSLGHQAGDLLLVSMAERIQAQLRAGDLLARFGGDEFTVLLGGVSRIEDATGVAERILDAVQNPVLLPDGHEVIGSLSIGIALSSPGATRDDVLHDADVAMYEAKVSGRRGSYCIFDAEEMGERSAERIELEVGLRQAIERDELEVYYQPLFSVAERRIVAAEALVRWNHPERGLLGPAQFIGLAEETGLILSLGTTVLRKACDAARRWSEELGAAVTVGVNLSARQFQDSNLLTEIESVVAASGVDPALLCFEITESLAMQHTERTSEILRSLKSLGASVAIDDFGTGHSALQYLAQFPIDEVKIDRSFVEGIESDPVKSAIVAAVLAMTEAIGAQSVVEGVETESELRHVEALGCTIVQGYHLARPMPGAELERMLAAERGRAVVIDDLRWPASATAPVALASRRIV